MKQTKAFLDWLKEDYLSEEKILAAYREETRRHKQEQFNYMVDRMRMKLSPCNNCSSYATCHREKAQICQKAAQFNDTVRALAHEFTDFMEKHPVMTNEQQLEAIEREIHLANLKGSDQQDRYKWAVEHIQNILQLAQEE